MTHWVVLMLKSNYITIIGKSAHLNSFCSDCWDIYLEIERKEEVWYGKSWMSL